MRTRGAAAPIRSSPFRRQRWLLPAAATHRIMPRAIDGSVYSGYTGAGAESAGYGTLTEAVERVVTIISSSHESTFTYLYIPFIDAAEHTYGPRSRESAQALGRVTARLQALAGNISGRARIVITADHGLVEVPPTEQTILSDDDPLLALLQFPPTCEPRLPAFHVSPGREAAFETHFEERFGEHWALLTTDEAEAAAPVRAGQPRGRDAAPSRGLCRHLRWHRRAVASAVRGDARIPRRAHAG